MNPDTREPKRRETLTLIIERKHTKATSRVYQLKLTNEVKDG